uniref:Inhibitor of F(1)F(o)-ATPase n=1 Tax=Bos mutus grunniens TaxID=30521 RepID=A0A8B9XUI9_BOSMU
MTQGHRGGASLTVVAETGLEAQKQLRVQSLWCRLGLGCRGAFEKGERAEEKRSFRARARELQLAALKKHHENEISHHAKETECLKRETERHKRNEHNVVTQLEPLVFTSPQSQ